MNNEDENNQPLETEAGIWMTGNDPDPLLEILVSLLEDKQMTAIPITVNVSGQVVTGDMISREAWFATVLELSQGPAESIITKLRDSFTAAIPEEEDHLHIRNARFVSSGGVSPDSGAHWRCKIGAVGSWCWGSPATRD